MNRWGLVAAAVAAGLGAVLLTPGAAQAATAGFEQENAWSSGYVGRITVDNDGAAAMATWRVEFDLPAGTTVAHHWNAVLSRSGTHHVFTPAHWNSTIAPGASTSFGWVAAGTGVPQNCLLNGAPCDGRPPAPDVQPPTTPANLRSGGQGSVFTLTWDASTDNVGVTGYEIWTGTGTAPVATVTGTSYRMPPPPPVVMSFGVRAIDAAGNRSPFVTLGLGTPPDVTAPTAPTGLSIYGSGIPGYYAVRWTASRDDQFVAGYEINLNGTVISRVGTSPAYFPVSGYGVYQIAIRAFDGAGNFSPRALTGIAVDPVPPVPPAPR